MCFRGADALQMNMSSSDDCFSSSSPRTLLQSHPQTSSPPTVVFPLPPTKRAYSKSKKDITTNPSTTLISPKQRKRRAPNDSSSGSNGPCTKVKPPGRKRLKGPKKSDCPVPKSPSQPCLHPDAKTKPVKQRRSPKSPVSGKKGDPLPKHSPSPQCSTKVLKGPVKAASKKGSRLSKATVEQGDTSPNVLTTGTKTGSLAKRPGRKTAKNDTMIKTVKASNESTRKQLMTKDQSGGTVRKRKKTHQSQTPKVSLGSPSPELIASLQSSNPPTVSQSSDSSLLSTPKRGRGRPRLLPRPCLSSTPDGSLSSDNNPFSVTSTPLASKLGVLQDTSPIRSWKVGKSDPVVQVQMTPESDVGKPIRRGRGRPRKHPVGMTTQGNKKGPSQTGKSEPEIHAAGAPNVIQPPTRSRPRFELQESMSPEQGPQTSSDLSIELSLQEDHLTSLTFQEEEEEEEEQEEEELPSFLTQTDKKPLSITEGICVWCKCRNYPFWPAMVKRVNNKLKKASIVFIDDRLFDKKIRKGFSVGLKTLKPFDCEEASQLMSKAKEKYEAAIKWCMELISDYRIRIGCGSFVGSLIEYFANDISCPVRRKYPQGTSDLTFPKLIMEEQGVTSDGDESSIEQQQEPRCKKLLPDRSRAARNRANKKLVHFIIRGKVDKHLLAVISGEQPSRWLKSFLKVLRGLKGHHVDTYLEDEEQMDQVYRYLQNIYKGALHTTPDLAHVSDPIRLVLDVLLPEAVIYAIAGVDQVSLAEAEEKYLKGHCLSKREREEFDLMLEKQMRMKAIHQHPAH